MIIPAIVFDIGGTLIHPDFAVLREWIIERTKVDVSTTIVERAFRLAIAGDVFTATGNEIEIQSTRFFTLCSCPPILRRYWIEWWMEIVDSGGVGSWLYKILDAEAVTTLLVLRRLGCRLIAASNSDGTLEAELRSFGLLEFFDEVYDSALLGVEKPSLTFYEHILRNTPSATIMHVGDDLIKDILGASTAGFRRVFLYDRAGIYEGVPSHIRIHRLSEVIAEIGLEE